MLSKVIQTKIQKIKHCPKILNFGASKPRVGGPGHLVSPGSAPRLVSRFHVQGKGGYPDLMSGGGGIPNHVTYPIMHALLLNPLLNRMTDIGENFTFPQLRLADRW